MPCPYHPVAASGAACGSKLHEGGASTASASAPNRHRLAPRLGARTGPSHQPDRPWLLARAALEIICPSQSSQSASWGCCQGWLGLLYAQFLSCGPNRTTPLRSLHFNTLDYVRRVASSVLQPHTPDCVERGEALGTGSQGLRAPVDGLQATEPVAAINAKFAKALFT